MTLLSNQLVPRIHFAQRTRNFAAFTLIEMLMVLAIIVIVIAITVPALGSASAAAQLTAAGDLVSGKIIDAQQQAIAHDSEVELRFYEIDSLDEGDSALSIRSLQSFTLQPDAEVPTFKPYGSLTAFGSGIVLSAKSKLSSFIDRGFTTETDESSEEGAGAGRRYLSIRFLPDGSTNLPPGNGPWFLTLVNKNTEDKTVVPSNFYTIQVDPITGRVRIFRP